MTSSEQRQPTFIRPAGLSVQRHHNGGETVNEVLLIMDSGTDQLRKRLSDYLSRTRITSQPQFQLPTGRAQASPHYHALGRLRKLQPVPNITLNPAMKISGRTLMPVLP
jgi:hypothetical protein